MTKDKVVLSWISGYDIPFNDTLPIRTCLQLKRHFSKEDKKNIKLEINKLKQLGAISECLPKQDQFLSPIFLTPKPNGTFRFILNLKDLNKFIPTNHFKLEDIRTVCKLITHDCFMATIDLKEAYFSVPIADNSKKYLRFQFEGKIYEFNALPYGLCTAPYVFTKILKPIVSYLRKQNILISIYLDDILCINDDYQTCCKNIQIICDLLESLGFVINREKSCLTPSKQCKYLGFIVDSQLMSLSLPIEKTIKLKQTISVFKCKKQCKIREFAQLLGLLNSACPAVKYGLLYTKLLERERFLALHSNNDNYDAVMKIPETLYPDLDWWLNKLGTSDNPIRQQNYVVELFSDASQSGWGAVGNNNKVSGSWTVEEQKCHINYLELKAAFFGLKCLAKNLLNCEILLRIDNTTAISYINRMGGIQYPHLNSIAREIWQWCETRNVFVFASYINTKDNIEADYESRKSNIEWELSHSAFQEIVINFGQPDIDLFASRSNNKCDTFISWKQDPDAIAVDAFTVKWSQYFFYAFPPFSIILKVLQKIKNDQAVGVLVVPYWTTQPWFPLFSSMLIKEPIIFHPNKTLISSNFREHHPLHETLTLVAGLLSAKP